MRVFAKRFYGFDPVTWPVVSFGKAGNRDALITASDPGDLILIVGTQSEPTAPRERGCLLGLAEFDRTPVDTSELIDLKSFEPSDIRAGDAAQWPKSLPILRAWRFEGPLLKLVDVLREQLTFDATVQAVELDEADRRTVLAIPRHEVAVTLAPRAQELMALKASLSSGRTSTGPTPTDWEGTVTRTAAAEAWTYAMRYGKRNIWKVGHSQDTTGRLREINLHVPHEETGERWYLAVLQRWPTSQDAFDMEQRVFAALRQFRTEGERIRCTEAQILSAWSSCLATANGFSELSS